MAQKNNKLETNYITNHISSGGFIFYKDKKTKEIFTLLIKNRKGEYWIPKGHLEEGEDQVDAAYREIAEEITLKKSQLKYVGFCSLIKYSFTENEAKNNKEVYINIFETLEKNKLTPRIGDIEVLDIEWFKYSDALQTISFNKEELTRSKEMYEKYLLGSNS